MGGTTHDRLNWLTGHPALPLVLFLVAFALCVWNLDAQSLWFDEVLTANYVQMTAAEIVRGGQSLVNLPFYQALRLLAVHPDTPFALRYLPALLGSLAVPLTYAVGRDLIGRRAGLLAAGLLALSPWYHWYCQEARSYAWVLTLTLAGFWRFLVAWDRTRRLRSWAGLAACQVAAIYAHLFAILANVALTAWVAIEAVRRKRWKQLRRWLGVQLVVGAAVLPVLWLARQNQEVFPELTGPGWIALGDLALHLSGTKYLTCCPLAALGLVLVWLVALIGGIAVLVMDARDRAGPFLLCWLVLPPAALYLASWFFSPVYVHRYLLLLLPGTLLILSALLTSHRLRVVLRVGLLVLLAAGQLLGGYQLQTDPDLQRPDWRTAVSLAPNVGPDDLVLLHPSLFVVPWSYYQGQAYPGLTIQVRTLDGRSEGGVLAESEVGRALAALTPSVLGDLWLVEIARLGLPATSWVAQNPEYRLISRVYLTGGLQITQFGRRQR